MSLVSGKSLDRYFDNCVKQSGQDFRAARNSVYPVVRSILGAISSKDCRFGAQPGCVGSVYSSLGAGPVINDFDINVTIKGVPRDAIQKNNNTSRKFELRKPDKSDSSKDVAVKDPVRTHDQSLKMAPSTEPLPKPDPGYCNIQVDKLKLGKEWRGKPDNWVHKGSLNPFNVRNQFKQQLTDSIQKLGLEGKVTQKKKVSGPAITIEYSPSENEKHKIDLAPIVDGCMDIPRSWPKQGAMWPSPSKQEAIRKAGCGAVASKNYDWWVSYGKASKELMVGIDRDGGCRRQTLRTMKTLRNDVWCNTTKPVITSYHLQNLLFWECHDCPRSRDWTNDKKADRFICMTRRLQGYIGDRHLPLYFDPSVNLLSARRAEDLDIAGNKIHKFMSNPAKYLVARDREESAELMEQPSDDTGL